MTDPIDQLRSRIEITPEIEKAFLTITEERRFRRGETISARADIAGHLFYMIEGSARVFYLQGDKEHTYSFAFENEYIPLSHPLVTREEYHATIEFLQPSKVAILPFEKINEVFKNVDRSLSDLLINQLLRSLVAHMAALEERVLMLQTLSAPERYRWLIGHYPEIIGRATLTQIASYLGVTKETIYRIRAGKY